MAIRLHFKEFGFSSSSITANPIMLLIHGGASSGRMYEDIVSILTEQDYHVVIPDLPGHGQTAISTKAALAETSKNLFTFSSATESLKDLIQQLRQRCPSAPIVLIGISLGGQVVLDVISKHPEIVDTAIVSGASIHPPDDKATWEMPRLPLQDERWMKILTEDLEVMGMENSQGIQDASFGFTFELPPDIKNFPPTLVLVGERDTPMSRRDFEELADKVKKANPKSDSAVLKGAWHNHSIDVPELFAEVVTNWIGSDGKPTRFNFATTLLGDTVQDPYPDSEILQLIKDGVMGSGGLIEALNSVNGSGVQAFYQDARLYNSGPYGIDYSDLEGGGGSTHCYASDIANRMTGWVSRGSTCTLNA